MEEPFEKEFGLLFKRKMFFDDVDRAIADWFNFNVTTNKFGKLMMMRQMSSPQCRNDRRGDN